MTETRSEADLTPPPQGLNWVFGLHAIISLVFGLAFAFVPDMWADVANWRAVDPTLTRVFGGGLIAVAAASALGSQARSWEAVRILVLFEIAFPALVGLAGLYEVLVADAPAFTWVIVGVGAVFTIAFAYYYRLLGWSSQASATGSTEGQS